MGSWIAIAMAAGAAVAAQVTVLGRATRDIHPLVVSLALQIAGAVVGGVWATQHGLWPEASSLASRWWLVPLGAIGWGIVAALGYAAARAGTAATLAVVVASQLAVGLVLDVTGGRFRVGGHHVVGLALLVVGAALISRR